MLNAEGARGHQYADKFSYLTCDLVRPYRYAMYEEVLRAAAATKPGAIIIDSMSHAHDGPGGFLEWHVQELDRLAGKDSTGYERDKHNFSAWITPKAAENAFRYALLEVACPVILCMRAKEKLKIMPGGKPKALGWQPIVGEGIAFETIFTVTLPPYSKGVPDLEISELREPFEELILKGQPIDEALGKRLADWAAGQKKKALPATTAGKVATARESLGYPEEQFNRIVVAKIGAPLEGAPDEEIESKLLPFLRLLKQKDRKALDELAEILSRAAA